MAWPLTEPPGAFAGTAVPRPGDCRASIGAIRASNGAIRGIGQHHDSPPAPGDCRASSGATPFLHAESKGPAEWWRHSLMNALNPGTVPRNGNTPGPTFTIYNHHVSWRTATRPGDDRTRTAAAERRRRHGRGEVGGGGGGGNGVTTGGTVANNTHARARTHKRTNAQMHKRTNAYTHTHAHGQTHTLTHTHFLDQLSHKFLDIYIRNKH